MIEKERNHDEENHKYKKTDGMNFLQSSQNFFVSQIICNAEINVCKYQCYKSTD